MPTLPQSPRYPYPRTNGPYLQFPSLSFTLNGKFLYDIAAINNISDACERGVVNGLSRMPLGKTAGNNVPEALEVEFFTTFVPILDDLIDQQKAGLYDGEIFIHIEITERNQPRQTRDFIGVSLDKITESFAYGNEPLKSTYTFGVLGISRNGRNPVAGINLGFTPVTIPSGFSI